MKRYLITDKKYGEIVDSQRNHYNLSELHQEILFIYKEIKRVCDKYNLRYFAEGGTWVGAMLRNAILLNDDDLDIRMPRADFNKLIEVAKKELPPHLELLNYTNSPYSRANMVKVHNINTTFIESSKKNAPMEWGGVFVDIVPYDNAPDYWLEREELYYEGTRLYVYNILRKKNEIKLNLFKYKTNTWWHWLGVENDIKLPNNIFSMFALYIFIMLHSVNYYAKKLDELWQGFENDESIYITCPERPWEKEGRILYVKRNDYGGSIQQKFYDTTIPVPIGYQGLNIQSYGYPARIEDTTKKLADGFLDLKCSYKKYRIKAIRH